MSKFKKPTVADYTDEDGAFHKAEYDESSAAYENALIEADEARAEELEEEEGSADNC